MSPELRSVLLGLSTELAARRAARDAADAADKKWEHALAAAEELAKREYKEQTTFELPDGTRLSLYFPTTNGVKTARLELEWGKPAVKV